ncbi:MAG: RnfABCDGE type electron transport complex subunit D [Bacilli bacterium]|jgi:electron transport complex protein RnfD
MDLLKEGPYLKDQENTNKMMKRLLLSLIPIILFAIYKNGIYPYWEGSSSLGEAFRPLFLILIASGTSILAETLYVSLVLKKKKEDLKEYLKHSYALFPGLFLALISPYNTPYWLIIFGSITATILGKMLFGGFGYNIFNPALIGSLFMTSSYGALITSRGGYLNPLEIDTITSSTPLMSVSKVNYLFNFSDISFKFGTLFDYFFGFIPGALGETSKILILIALIYLIITKVIKWRIPLLYLLTVFIMTFIIGFSNGMGFWYPLFHLLSGGLLFGAVFMATDPVTSPITKKGQILFALSLGLLTVILRFLTSYPEGVLTAILTMNMFVFILDKIGVKGELNKKGFLSLLLIFFIIILGISFYIGNSLKNIDVKEEITTITEIKKEGSLTKYYVSTKGFAGLIKAEVITRDNQIKEIKIISQNESYWKKIESNDYLNTLIINQDNINNVDAISGATFTSESLKEIMVRVIKEEFKEVK